MKQRGVPVWIVAVALLGAVGWYLAGGSLDRIGSDSRDTASTGVVATDPSPDQFSDLAPVAVDALPPEARNTIDLILGGGPFPFSRDDSIFQNRERLLPLHDNGYYREYTVITPGSDDRGARRIVAGADGDFYYTSDHYSSFREIIGVES